MRREILRETNSIAGICDPRVCIGDAGPTASGECDAGKLRLEVRTQSFERNVFRRRDYSCPAAETGFVDYFEFRGDRVQRRHHRRGRFPANRLGFVGQQERNGYAGRAEGHSRWRC